MYSFEDTQRETIRQETAQQIIEELNDKVLYPSAGLSYNEFVETPLEFDMTIGGWIAFCRDWGIKVKEGKDETL